jgi:hypothetical protein
LIRYLKATFFEVAFDVYTLDIVKNNPEKQTEILEGINEIGRFVRDLSFVAIGTDYFHTFVKIECLRRPNEMIIRVNF